MWLVVLGCSKVEDGRRGVGLGEGILRRCVVLCAGPKSADPLKSQGAVG